MEILVVMYCTHVEKLLEKKPQIAWLLLAPTEPLILWISAKAIILEAFGKLGWWEGFAYFAASLLGIWLSVLSSAHLIAWGWYIATGLKDPAAVKPREPNPDDLSESN